MGALRYNFRDGFLDFLKAASADKEGYPNSLDILLKEGGVKLVLSSKDDPDDAGFVQWRTAFYVAGADGCVENFFFLLDDFFLWKANQMAKEVEVHVYQHGGQVLGDEAQENFQYEHYTFHEAEDVPPLKWYECSPVVSKRIVLMHLQPETESTLSVMFGGNTYSFRAALDEAGVKGAAANPLLLFCCFVFVWQFFVRAPPLCREASV